MLSTKIDAHGMMGSTMETPVTPVIGSTMETPVTLLTGFLGAGKTTLLNRILRNRQGLRVGVLVNDFGAVNIDARLVAAVEGDSISLTNGCICCTMQGDLVTSVLRLLRRDRPPDHLVVEASGISDPVGVIQAFRTQALRDRTRLDGVVAVVDAENARNPRLDQQLVEDQIQSADIVLLNKVDLAPGDSLPALRDWIGGLAPRSRVIETVHAEVPLEVVLGIAGRSEPDRGFDLDAAALHTHHDGSAYSTWAYETRCRLDYRLVRDTLEALPPDIFRAKGILSLADAPGLRFLAQVVGRRVSIDVMGPWEEEPATVLVFIGRSGSVDGEDLSTRLDACRTDTFPLMTDDAFHRLLAMRKRPVPA